MPACPSPWSDPFNAFARLVLVALLALLAPGFSIAQAADAREALLGNWTLVSVVIEQDGTRREPFGPAPKGRAIFERDGNFIVLITRGDLPRISANNREQPTAEESRQIATGLIAYFGKYSVDRDGQGEYRIEACTYPNWNGLTQKRLFKIEGDRLMVMNATPPVGGGSSYAEYVRTQE